MDETASSATNRRTRDMGGPSGIKIVLTTVALSSGLALVATVVLERVRANEKLPFPTEIDLGGLAEGQVITRSIHLRGLPPHPLEKIATGTSCGCTTAIVPTLSHVGQFPVVKGRVDTAGKASSTQTRSPFREQVSMALDSSGAGRADCSVVGRRPQSSCASHEGSRSRYSRCDRRHTFLPKWHRLER